ncbi:MAG: Hsp70 family protein, partial [Deltaproteobacteria bacterium]|nr:Hsp70 family protein [Kofleriaceae bacterium]
MSDPIVGIDLGTTNSVVAVCDASGQPRVLTDQRGTKIHPSVVSFHPNGSVIVGVDAKQRRVIDPRNTVYSAKRLIGRLWKSKEIQAAIGRMPYTIKEGANQQPVLVTRGGEFAVPEISAIVLDHVRNIAKQALGQEISRAVVTVPASFTDAQRSATATAGAIAGITVVRVLNEPTAAALAYGHQRQLSRTIAVYDFGGGTFDVTILRLQDQVYEVLATAGDSFLGGDDIDEVLMNHMADQFLASHRIDVRDNEVGVMRLRAVAEQTKIELSRRTRAIVKVDEIAYGPGGAPLNLEVEITRDQLVERAAPFFDKSFAVCEEALRLAQLSPAQIEDVVLVGGTTKIPHVRERVTRFFQRPPRTDVNPEGAVAVGAALQASALERILSRRPSPRP